MENWKRRNGFRQMGVGRKLLCRASIISGSYRAAPQPADSLRTPNALFVHQRQDKPTSRGSTAPAAAKFKGTVFWPECVQFFATASVLKAPLSSALYTAVNRHAGPAAPELPLAALGRTVARTLRAPTASQLARWPPPAPGADGVNTPIPSGHPTASGTPYSPAIHNLKTSRFT